MSNLDMRRAARLRNLHFRPRRYYAVRIVLEAMDYRTNEFSKVYGEAMAARSDADWRRVRARLAKMEAYQRRLAAAEMVP